MPAADACESIQQTIDLEAIRHDPNGYLEENAVLRARERLCEQELLDQQQDVWHVRIACLEELCQELSDEEASSLTERAGLDEAAAERLNQIAAANVQAIAAAKRSKSEAQAAMAEAQIKARASEREEVLLEAVTRERVQTSMIHANSAYSLQARSESLQAATDKEVEVVSAFAAELQALEARAVMEERRMAHEQKVQSLQMQVTEAAALEAQSAAEEEAEACLRRDEEDSDKHAALMRRLRAAAMRRLATLEEEQETRKKELQEARYALRDADQQSATLLTSLRSQHAADGQRIAAAKAGVLEELQLLASERQEREAALAATETEISSVEASTQAAAEQALAAKTASDELAVRSHLVLRIQEESEEKDAQRLAQAEHALAEELRQQEQHHRRLMEEEQCAADQHRTASAAEAAVAADSEKLRQELQAVRCRAQSMEVDLASELQASSSIASAKSAELAAATGQELAAAEAACADAVARATARRAESLGAAVARRDQGLRRLSELRVALRRQHEEAEAEHARALGQEHEAELEFLRLQSQVYH
eukprot:TRINITY_DN27330_c0_g3_i1.p1 TRINITY_DN27330_c0_g3~~TRINITY_DN27330_c0_g3_i1.p1  ORF type:complete len:543 (-),score=198.69 TRINITY_DN27330_c0_g3_i1:85-1713(-)